VSDEQKPSDSADKAADGAFLAWVASHPTATLASKEEARLLDEIDRLRDENAALRAAVERVRALHKPPPNTFESVWFGNDGQVLLLVCNECGENLPCPTLRALERTP